jgi:hypothetical protein
LLFFNLRHLPCAPLGADRRVNIVGNGRRQHGPRGRDQTLLFMGGPRALDHRLGPARAGARPRPKKCDVRP